MSDTKAAFFEGTKQSLKITLHRYMKDDGYKHIHKMSHFVGTLNFKKMLGRFDTDECQEVRHFVSSVHQTTTKI